MAWLSILSPKLDRLSENTNPIGNIPINKLANLKPLMNCGKPNGTTRLFNRPDERAEVVENCVGKTRAGLGNFWRRKPVYTAAWGSDIQDAKGALSARTYNRADVMPASV